MCGIAGIFVYGPSAPPVDQAELVRIRERMMNRGPDGAGLWIAEDQRIGLAHRRLSIIDITDAGAQPMLDPDTGNRIVFNGEIYNYQALRDELQAAGARFRSHSDTEVLLKLYAAQGPELLHRLRGMFAFAIWDARQQGLFIARDHFGIKPLYLADDGQTLRLASQVKALLAGGRIDTAPEPAGHVGFFLWGHVPEPYSLYIGIRALPAGTSLWIDRAGHRTQRTFFNLTHALAQTQPAPPAITPQAAREQLYATLLDSVCHHLIADVPVGVFLSAGLDSTTIAALAKEAGVAELRTVTLGFREFAGTDNDETPLAEAVARQYGATHHTQWVRRQDFTDHFDHLLDAMDQPTIDGVNSYFVCLATKAAGLKVALSGLSGDELFGGYAHFQGIPRLVGWVRPLAAIPGLGRGFRWVSAPLLKRLTSPKAAGLIEYGGDYAGAYLLLRGFYMPWELTEVLDGELVRHGWRELATGARLRKSIQGLDAPRLKITALETAGYRRNQRLRDTDWASMTHSLEVRIPLVDLELTRRDAGLIHAGPPPTKQDMAAVPATARPRSMHQRKKTGFSVPVREWLTAASSGSADRAPKTGLRGRIEAVGGGYPTSTPAPGWVATQRQFNRQGWNGRNTLASRLAPTRVLGGRWISAAYLPSPRSIGSGGCRFSRPDPAPSKNHR